MRGIQLQSKVEDLHHSLRDSKAENQQLREEVRRLQADCRSLREAHSTVVTAASLLAVYPFFFYCPVKGFVCTSDRGVLFWGIGFFFSIFFFLGGGLPLEPAAAAACLHVSP